MATPTQTRQAIESQPDAVRTVLRDARAACIAAAELLAGARRIFLVGTGTSSHAAIIGAHMPWPAGAQAVATTSFDFVTYPRPLGPTDAILAISHTGTSYNRQAIALARAAGARVVGITGQQSKMMDVEARVEVCPPEQSATYTVSYTTSLAALALIAAEYGERVGAAMGEYRVSLERLPEALRAVLAHEERIALVADLLAARGRLILVGAGPNMATAREGALKVKESSYLTAEGFELETALHGGLQAVEAGDVAVVIAAQGPALERARELARALSIIGARIMLIADERVMESVAAACDPAPMARIPFAAAPEALSPILAVAPLQLLALLTAERRGTNPDNFRYDEARYKQAVESYSL